MHYDQVKNLFPMALQLLLWQIPYMLVYIAGFVVALVNWRRYPKPSLLVVIATSVSFVVSIVWAFAFAFVWYLRTSQGWTIKTYGFINSALSITHTILGAGALSLFLFAVYIGRRSELTAGEQASQGVRRVSLPLYVSSIAVGQLLGGPLFLFGVILFAISSNSYSSDSSSIVYGLMIAVGVILMLTASILYLVLIYKAWESIQDGYARTTPGQAVGFLFIPFYNFYWIFQAIPGFADDYNAYLIRAKISAPPLDKGLLQAQAILQVLSAIPYLGMIFALALMPINCIVAAKICTAINALPETAASATPA
jgi:hypothetical protein